MRFTIPLLAIAGTTVLADCTYPYCYSAGSYYYACESDADCLRLNRTECATGLESPVPSGSLCLPWGGGQEANFTYVTESCIYPYCFNVQGWYSYGCNTDADCVAVEMTTCKVGPIYAIGFLTGRCY